MKQCILCPLKSSTLHAQKKQHDRFRIMVLNSSFVILFPQSPRGRNVSDTYCPCSVMAAITYQGSHIIQNALSETFLQRHSCI